LSRSPPSPRAFRAATRPPVEKEQWRCPLGWSEQRGWGVRAGRRGEKEERARPSAQTHARSPSRRRRRPSLPLTTRQFLSLPSIHSKETHCEFCDLQVRAQRGARSCERTALRERVPRRVDSRLFRMPSARSLSAGPSAPHAHARTLPTSGTHLYARPGVGIHAKREKAEPPRAAKTGRAAPPSLIPLSTSSPLPPHFSSPTGSGPSPRTAAPPPLPS